MTSGTVSSLFVLLLSCTPALAQQTTANAQFNQVLNINGDMQLNSFVFPDRSKVETFSQKQQQLIVNQNTPPIPANQVTGSTGQPFVAMMAQSMSISTNGAVDLVGGQVELALDPQMLANNAVNPDNTFVAMLSPDRQTWMIQETMRSVNISDMTVRMVKRSNIDGEYMALGRQTVETNAFLTTFGDDSASSITVQGTGLQENEFQDGFRMSTRATQPMTMNVNVNKGVDPGMLTALQGQQPINDFRYSVTSNLAGVLPDLNQQVTVVQMPINAQRIQRMMQAAGVQPNGQVAVAVAQRGVLQNPGGATGNLGITGAQRRGRSLFREEIAKRQVQGQQAGQAPPAGQGQQAGTPTNGNNPVATQLLLAPTFTPVQAEAVLDTMNMRIAIPVRAIDGEFILTMQVMGQGAQPQAQTPPQEGQQPQGQTPPAEGQRPAEGQGQQPTETQTPAGEGQQPPAGETARPEGEAPRPEGEAPRPEGATNGTALAEPRPAKRQEEAKSGEQKAPLGSVIMTVEMINQMAELEQWGGQAPITKMMNEYVKSQTGKEPEAVSGGEKSNGTSTTV